MLHPHLPPCEMVFFKGRILFRAVATHKLMLAKAIGRLAPVIIDMLSMAWHAREQVRAG